MPINYDKPFELRDARNGSWFWVHTHIWRDKRLKSTERDIYATLASYCNTEQQAFPSVRRIAKDTGKSARHVYRCLQILEKYHYISVERKKGKVNLYTLLKTTPAKLSPVTPMSLPRIPHVTGSSDTRDTLTISNRTISINNRRKLEKIKEKNPINIL